MNIAIVLAGGVGTRTGLEIPKQFYKIMTQSTKLFLGKMTLGTLTHFTESMTREQSTTITISKMILI